MAREDLIRVTEPFYMVDKSRSRKAGGAGLGLSLCAEIAKKHNAQFTIESILGEGTMVTINIKCFVKKGGYTTDEYEDDADYEAQGNTKEEAGASADAGSAKSNGEVSADSDATSGRTEEYSSDDTGDIDLAGDDSEYISDTVDYESEGDSLGEEKGGESEL